jgi:hypothetical protein
MTGRKPFLPMKSSGSQTKSGVWTGIITCDILPEDIRTADGENAEIIFRF